MGRLAAIRSKAWPTNVEMLVRQHDPALTCGPSEDGRITGARQTYVLDANEIELWEVPTKTANDLGVEVLVRTARHAAG
jgi:hypothetical protein